MTDIVEIYERYLERKRSQGSHLAEMVTLTEAYEGAVMVPLPELDRNETTAIANLLAQGLDQSAMRIASTLPDVFYPPTRPGQDLAEKNSRISRQANLGWWAESAMSLKMRRRARWLIGYACSPVLIRPDSKAGIPRWHLRSPLTSFPAVGEDLDDMVPSDCIFAFKRSYSWVRRSYPAEVVSLSKGSDCMPDTMFELLEYVDSDEIVLMVIGRPRDPFDSHGVHGTAAMMELERTPNRAGCPMVVIPGRIGLDRAQGAYNGMIGMYQQQAKLQALELIAVTEGVFPNQWLIARPNENPQIVQVANGRLGVLGVVRGGEIETPPMSPGYKTDSTMDRIERAQRLEGGIPAEFGGESPTNVRTGKRGDSVLSATIDFPVQEAQNLLAESMQHENRIAVAVARNYFGSQKKTFYITARNAKGRVDYVPNKNLVSDANIVTYSHAGSDANALVVGLGQRLGVGTLSKHTARALDPLIDDAQAEADWIVAESLESALLAGIGQMVQSGQLGPADVATIASALKEDRLSLEAAVLQVQKAKQQAQASSGPPGSPEGPVDPNSPEAQPGLTPPPPGGGAPPQAGTIAASPNEQGLAQLLGSLKGGNPQPAMVR